MSYACACGRPFDAATMADYQAHQRTPEHRAWHARFVRERVDVPVGVFARWDAYERRRVA